MLRLLLTASLERMAMALERVPLFGKQLAGVVLAAGLVMPAARSDTPGPPGMMLEHARVNVHRNDDGS
jgi:hypothetical protein